MRPPGSNLRLVVTISLLAILLTSFVRSYALEESADSSLSPGQSSCAVSVRVDGSGSVQLSRSGVADRHVTESERVTAECSELVTLSAKPAGPWEFERWLGVTQDKQLQPVIVVPAPADITAVFTPREITYIPAERPYYDRSGELVDEIAILEPIRRSPAENSANEIETSSQVIDVWYGDSQPFGQPGVAQKWFDVTGSVSNSAQLDKLEYKLNNRPLVAINYGSDARRLYNPGDFVIDLDVADLTNGENTISIIATDKSTATVTKEIVVDYTPSAGWPLPSNVDWDSAGTDPQDLQNVSQIVDGQWQVVDNGVTIAETDIGYDRTIAVGGIEWTDFEAEVPVTIHNYSVEDEAYNSISVSPALGVVMHWQGHSDVPNLFPACTQPKCGWLYAGMYTWFDYNVDRSGDGEFQMWVHHGDRKIDTSGLQLDPGKTYIWKVQSDSSEGGPFGIYRMKVWEEGDTEPPWLMERAGTAQSLKAGSLLLLAHHVEVTFGDVKLRPLNGDFESPEISDIDVQVETTSATIGWKTDEDATSSVEYYSSSPDEAQVVANGDLDKIHQIVLPDLQPDTTYTYQVTSVDGSLNEATSEAQTFKTDPILYTLQVTTQGVGVVDIAPDQPEYVPGDIVSVEAVPGPKRYLSGWVVNVDSGDDITLDPDENPLMLEMVGNTTVVAMFKKYDVKFYLPMTTGVN